MTWPSKEVVDISLRESDHPNGGNSLRGAGIVGKRPATPGSAAWLAGAHVRLGHGFEAVATLRQALAWSVDGRLVRAEVIPTPPELLQQQPAGAGAVDA